MSKPPINPDKTLAGIALDPQTLERVIPESKRPDGSVRKQIKIRPGFTPQEDVRKFRGTRQAQMDANALPKGSIIGWLPPTAVPPAKPLSKSAKKNAKRREKKEEKKEDVPDNWEDDEEDGDAKAAGVDGKKTEGVSPPAKQTKTESKPASLPSPDELSSKLEELDIK